MGHICLRSARNITVQHVAKPRYRADWMTIRFAREGGQGMKGPKNEGRPVNQMQMTPFAKMLCHIPPLLFQAGFPKSGYRFSDNNPAKI